MFTGRVARQTNRLYVLRMTETGLLDHQPFTLSTIIRLYIFVVKETIVTAYVLLPAMVQYFFFQPLKRSNKFIQSRTLAKQKYF